MFDLTFKELKIIIKFILKYDFFGTLKMQPYANSDFRKEIMSKTIWGLFTWLRDKFTYNLIFYHESV